MMIEMFQTPFPVCPPVTGDVDLALDEQADAIVRAALPLIGAWESAGVEKMDLQNLPAYKISEGDETLEADEQAQLNGELVLRVGSRLYERVDHVAMSYFQGHAVLHLQLSEDADEQKAGANGLAHQLIANLADNVETGMQEQSVHLDRWVMQRLKTMAKDAMIDSELEFYAQTDHRNVTRKVYAELPRVCEGVLGPMNNVIWRVHNYIVKVRELEEPAGPVKRFFLKNDHWAGFAK